MLLNRSVDAPKRSIDAPFNKIKQTPKVKTLKFYTPKGALSAPG